MAIITDIADAVVAELNGGSFSQSFLPERAYRPAFDLADMATLRVTVVPRSVEAAAASREVAQHDYQIDLAVQKKLSAASGDEPAELDSLMGLVQEVADFLRQRRLLAMPTAVWLKSANAPIYAAEHLEQLRQFTSVLTLTYRVLR